MNTLSGNTSSREPIVIKPNHTTVLSFYIDERDVGGTLAVELAIYNTKVLAAKLAISIFSKCREAPLVRLERWLDVSVRGSELSLKLTQVQALVTT